MIAIYITTENMTAALHAEGRKRLGDAGAPEGAMKMHSVFGEEGKLQVFDIWESQEAFDTFLGFLVPVLEELGITLAAPHVARWVEDALPGQVGKVGIR